jgi:hypothetical protein
MRRWACLLAGLSAAGWAQEAGSGFDLRTTLTASAFHSGSLTEEPRLGNSFAGGFRAMLYPTWKLSERWAVAGAVQVHSRPYFPEQFYTQGYGVKTQVLQAHLSYSRYWKDTSLVVRVGQLAPAFGSFLLRYDDFDNPVIQMPLGYGYYYKPVTQLGLAGAQVELTIKRLDLRAQFVNSSPANARSVFDREQYGSWVGGAGYTIRQGFRVGASAYRGPYLHRQYQYNFGEWNLRDLPATGYGIDVAWAAGHWNVYGELQRFQMAYRVIPTFTQHNGYAEVRRVLHPRWYVAGRAGYIRYSAVPGLETYETTVGYRPNARQLIKIGYQVLRGPGIQGAHDNVFTAQLVTSLRPFSFAWK